MSITATSPSAQVKVTLPAQLHQLVKSKATKYGLTLSTYIKHLVLDDVRDTEKIALKNIEASKKEFEAGEAKVLTSLADL